MEKKPILCLLLTSYILMSGVSATEEFMSLEWKYDTSGSASHVYPFKTFEGENAIITGVSYYTTTGAAGWLDAINEKGELLWEKKGFPPISSMRVLDLDGDGEDEIIMGVLQYIYCYNSKGKEKWHYATGPGNVINCLEIGDINGDGSDDIIAGGDSTHYSNINVVDGEGNSIWKARTAQAVNALAIGDINENGKPEIIAGTVAKHGIFYSPSRVYVFDSSGNKMWDKLMERGTASVEVADIDGDGKKEILAGSLHYFTVLDHQANRLMDYETKGYVNDIIVADIDVDGENEILLGSNDLYVLDSEGELEWENSAGGEAINDMELADLNSDGHPEIIIGSDSIYIVDYHGDEIWEYATEKAVKDIHLSDVDGDSYPELAAGSLDNFVYSFSSQIYQLRIKAQNNYAEAKRYYSSGRLDTAMEYALKAKDFYQQLENEQGISDTNKLIEYINSASTKKIEEKQLAYSYYNQSRACYLAGDYVNSTYWARKAQYKYDSLNNESMALKSEEIINNSLKFMLKEADESYNKALTQYNGSNYSVALSHAQSAAKRYVQLGYINQTLDVLELAADAYTLLAEKQRSGGEFEESGYSAQKALYIYSCIEESPKGYPPECYPGDINLKNISYIAVDLQNRSFNDSLYMNESVYLKSIIMAASLNDTGEYSFSLDSITSPITGSVDYLIKLVTWNSSILTVVFALLVTIILFAALYSMLSEQGIVPPIALLGKLTKKAHLPKRKPKPVIKQEHKPLDVKYSGYDVGGEQTKTESKVDKIKKDSVRGEGLSLNSLKDV
ncbi:MAG: hypothetical protein B6U97_03280 [Candidatus Altiarchaeales archaeon ex4484_96]|nr:MAG: hypothetical protein B6U97_03280 [Candidatus Altiarchaeales archaeon ex4484_96]